MTEGGAGAVEGAAGALGDAGSELVRQRQRRAAGRGLERRRPAQGVVAGIDQRQREQLLAGRAQRGVVERGDGEFGHGAAVAGPPPRQFKGR